jgi:hypothetical protein
VDRPAQARAGRVVVQGALEAEPVAEAELAEDAQAVRLQLG